MSAGLAVRALGERRGQPHGPDAAAVERRGVAAARVVEVGAATGHPGPEVRPDGAEDDDRPPGHVLAAVRADPLDDRLGAAVADREAHPGPTDEVEPAGGRAVEDRVAGDRLAGGLDRKVRLRGDRDRCRPTGPWRRSRSPGR